MTRKRWKEATMRLELWKTLEEKPTTWWINLTFREARALGGRKGRGWEGGGKWGKWGEWRVRGLWMGGGWGGIMSLNVIDFTVQISVTLFPAACHLNISSHPWILPLPNPPQPSPILPPTLFPSLSTCNHHHSNFFSCAVWPSAYLYILIFWSQTKKIWTHSFITRYSSFWLMSGLSNIANRFSLVPHSPQLRLQHTPGLSALMITVANHTRD